MVAHTCNPATQEVEQKNCKFWPSLDYFFEILYLKKNVFEIYCTMTVVNNVIHISKLLIEQILNVHITKNKCVK